MIAALSADEEPNYSVLQELTKVNNLISITQMHNDEF